MKSFPFDSHVQFDADGTPSYDRAIDSLIYRKLLSQLFTTGVSPNSDTNLKVVATASMSVDVHPGFAMLDGVMTMSEEVTTLTVSAADSIYDRIDSVVLRMNNNDDHRNCDLYVVSGVPSANPVHPDLTREASIYEVSLADIRVRAGVSDIRSDDITDTRYDTERCGVVKAVGEYSGYITSLKETVDYIIERLKASDNTEFRFGYDEETDKYGYYKSNGIFTPFSDGTGIIIDGVKYDSLVFETILKWEAVSILPYDFGKGRAVVDNKGAINILGGMRSGVEKKHYSFDGVAWNSVSVLPTEFYSGSVVVDNDGAIHILGGYRELQHNKYANGHWTTLNELPKKFSQGSAIVDKNGVIHILGGDSNNKSHYVYNSETDSWTIMGELPYSFAKGDSVLDEHGNINIIGSLYTGSGKNHYALGDDGVWSSVSTLPYDFDSNAVRDDDGNIHILGKDSGIPVTYHYVLRNSEWIKLDDLPFALGSDGDAVVCDNLINIFSEKSKGTKHYKLNKYYRKVVS